MLYCAVELVPVAEASKLVTIEVLGRESVSDAGMHCVRTILTTFYHMHHYRYAATGDMVKSFIILAPGFTWKPPKQCLTIMYTPHFAGPSGHRNESIILQLLYFQSQQQGALECNHAIKVNNE
jgi:hypothetical protein